MVQILCCYALNPSAAPTRRLVGCDSSSSYSFFALPFRRKILFLHPKAPISFRRPRSPVLMTAGSQESPQRTKYSELELLGKPSPPNHGPSASDGQNPRKPPDIEEALAPFLKFFKAREESEKIAAEEEEEDGEVNYREKSDSEGSFGAGLVVPGEAEKVRVQYYEPKPGELVVGVVVSGNEHRLDVNVGSDMLGTMLTKEVLPLYEAELSHLLCDLKEDAQGFAAPGKMGIVKDEEAFSGEKVPGRPVVEAGTILFAEVLGRTLSGRPLLSTRRMFRRIAWHRVRQIKHLNEPIEVKIFEWNTGGLLTRIEGLRSFLPKAELMNKAKNFTELKEHVGQRMYVCITKIDEATNDLIISEKEAWEMKNLKEGNLLEGTVRRIFPYGAQIMIDKSKRSGLLHISNISRGRVTSVNDVLKVEDKVKVLVVKSSFPDKVSLSTADLESEPGLFLSDRERVFAEAEDMARKYRKRLPVVSTSSKLDAYPAENVIPFEDEAKMCANWKWFKFEQDELSDNLKDASP